MTALNHSPHNSCLLPVRFWLASVQCVAEAISPWCYRPPFLVRSARQRAIILMGSPCMQTVHCVERTIASCALKCTDICNWILGSPIDSARRLQNACCLLKLVSPHKKENLDGFKGGLENPRSIRLYLLWWLCPTSTTGGSIPLHARCWESHEGCCTQALLVGFPWTSGCPL